MRLGDQALAVWSHADGGVYFPVEIVMLPSGAEPIEVVAGGPACYKMVNRKTIDQEGARFAIALNLASLSRVVIKAVATHYTSKRNIFVSHRNSRHGWRRD